MTGNDLRKARVTLGEMWGLDRALHASELGRALELSPSDPGESIRHYEKHRANEVPPSIRVPVQMFLSGALPPGGISSIRP